MTLEKEGNSFPQKNGRIVIENVIPEIDAGHYALKRTVGERVVVEADIFTDGHDVISAVLKSRTNKNPSWTETPLKFLVNDRWQGQFSATEMD